MKLEDKLAQEFAENGWTWNLAGDKTIVPTESDIEQALDEAARMLYNEEPGTQLEVGRLIIKKTPRGHDVYLFAGEYE